MAIEIQTNTLSFDTAPRRIISLVPSQTELLYYLGVRDEVIGITKFCVHPKQWMREKKIIGGTKNLRLNDICELKPDLILANKEENTKEEIEFLQTRFPTYISDISNFDEALKMIHEVGELTHKNLEAASLLSQLQNSKFKFPIPKSQISCFYLIWNKPYMFAGRNTYIDDMLTLIGFKNLVHENRYPTLEMMEMKQLDPKVILLSSEPYPFKQKHIDELSNDFPNSKIILVDGEMFSWYGSRMLQAFDYFSKLMLDLDN